MLGNLCHFKQNFNFCWRLSQLEITAPVWEVYSCTHHNRTELMAHEMVSDNNSHVFSVQSELWVKTVHKAKVTMWDVETVELMYWKLHDNSKTHYGAMDFPKNSFASASMSLGQIQICIRTSTHNLLLLRLRLFNSISRGHFVLHVLHYMCCLAFPPLLNYFLMKLVQDGRS